MNRDVLVAVRTTRFRGMTDTFAGIAGVSSTAENQDLRMVLLRDCAEIFLEFLLYLRRTERALMPVHGDAWTCNLTSADCYPEAGQPVLEIVFIALVYADGVGNQVGFAGIALPQSGNNDCTLRFEMSRPQPASKMNKKILILGIVSGPKIPGEKAVPYQSLLHSLQEAAEILDDWEAIHVYDKPSKSLLCPLYIEQGFLNDQRKLFFHHSGSMNLLF